MNLIKNINIDNFVKAYSQFEGYRQNILTKRDWAGAIQAFEYTYEMSLKVIKITPNRHGERLSGAWPYNKNIKKDWMATSRFALLAMTGVGCFVSPSCKD